MNKIFWIGCFPPEFHSIGDHAQTLAVKNFLVKNFNDYKIKRFYRTEIDKFFREKIEKDDLIFIHSSGDFGDLYANSGWHDSRKKIITTYTNNLIVQLPVTVHYKNTASFEDDKIFFADKHNVLILCRTLEGAELLKNNFGCRVEFFPDFVFSLKYNFKEKKRVGCLGILRQDNESAFRHQPLEASFSNHSELKFKLFNCGLLKKIGKQILWLNSKIQFGKIRDVDFKKRMLKLFPEYYINDTQVSNVDITDQNREAIVKDTLRFISGFERVITDRFHGCIFAYLTQTPFFALTGRIPQKTTIYPLDYNSYFSSFRNMIFTPSECKEEQESTNDILRLVKSRRSIRKWNTQEVELNKMQQILEAGIYAPSGANTQATRLKILARPNDIKLVCQNTSLWFRRNFPNKAIMVLYDTSKLRPYEKWVKRFIWQDTSCAMQNMMLVAESLGLRTCWASITPKQQKRIEKHFKIPKHLALTCMLFVGYSDVKVSLHSTHQGKTINRSLSDSILR